MQVASDNRRRLALPNELQPCAQAPRSSDFVATPTHGSWLNQVERWFGLLTQRQIKRGAHKSVASLKAAIKEFLDAHNDEGKPFVWTKSADDILASIARFATRTLAASDGER